MEIPKLFTELYEYAERHDIVEFNRELYHVLNKLDRGGICMYLDEIYDTFLDSTHCLYCSNQQETKVDLMLMDGHNVYTKVCPDCGEEIELYTE